MTASSALQLLDAQEIRTHWPSFREGVAKALEYDPDKQLPEDVFMALMTGNAGMYAAFDDAGVATGFVVVRRLQITGRWSLVVWLCWSGDRETTIARFWPEVVEIAAELGCSRIIVESARPYHRVIEGMKLVSHTYHFEVEDGRLKATAEHDDRGEASGVGQPGRGVTIQ